MRLANRFPEVIDALRVGQTSLEAITALAPILNKSNIVEMMSAACGKTALEVQALVAGPGKNVRVTLHLSPTVLTAVERVKGLIWHRKPTAKIEDVFEEAVEFYLDKCDPERKTIRQAATSRQPAPGRSLEPNRRIPQAIKDEVWHRDGGRCAYLKPDGSRCVEQKGLEYDHIVPFALGGPSNRVQNIRLLCWGHNQMEMRRRFGARA
jgi:5-methylcytosine-specific restriction endonuclease McrA